MKLKPLGRVIKSHGRRACCFCGSHVYSNAVQTTRNSKKIKVLTRSFQCSKCLTIYNYKRFKSDFIITNYEYKCEGYKFVCDYDINKYRIYKIKEWDRSWGKQEDEPVAEGIGVIPFPSTKEQVEEKIQIFVTFS